MAFMLCFLPCVTAKGPLFAKEQVLVWQITLYNENAPIQVIRTLIKNNKGTHQLLCSFSILVIWDKCGEVTGCLYAA